MRPLVSMLLWLLLSPAITLAAPDPEMGVIIERMLGTNGGLGKESLTLTCKAGSSAECQITQQAGSAKPLLAKLKRSEAKSLIQDFLANQARYSRSQAKSAQRDDGSPSLIRWGAFIGKRRRLGELSATRNQNNLFVLELERTLLARF